jgi:hypothetical protein
MKSIFLILCMLIVANRATSQLAKDAAWYKEHKVRSVLARENAPEKNGAVNRKLYEKKYDRDGMLTEFVMYSELDSNNATQTVTYRYNSNKDKIEEDSRFYVLMQNTKTIYSYDNKDKLLEGIQTDEKGNFKMRCINTYNSNGKLIEQGNVNARGTKYFKTTYEYDNAGNISVAMEYDSTGKATTKQVYKCNTNGNAVECLTYFPVNSSTPLKITYTYYTSTDGKEYIHIETQYSSAGVKLFQKFYNYDEKYSLVGQNTIYYNEGKSVTDKLTYYYSYYP